MTRIYLPAPLAEGQIVVLPEAAARHLVQVLRLRVGDGFVAFNGERDEFEATLHAVSKREAQACIGARHCVERESPLDLTLAQCVSKGERMDYTLQKAVELGITRIVPLLSERSVVKLDAERWDKKREHWRGILISACEQSGRTRIPELAAVQSLAHWLPQRDEGLRLTLAPTATDTLRSLPTPQSAVTLLIGPEGGLSDAEIVRAHAAGFTGIRLGPRVLRTETAGVAALAAIQALWGDWR